MIYLFKHEIHIMVKVLYYNLNKNFSRQAAMLKLYNGKRISIYKISDPDPRTFSNEETYRNTIMVRRILIIYCNAKKRMRDWFMNYIYNVFSFYLLFLVGRSSV